MKRILVHLRRLFESQNARLNRREMNRSRAVYRKTRLLVEQLKAEGKNPRRLEITNERLGLLIKRGERFGMR